MRNFSKKPFFSILAVSIFTAIFFSSIVQASFLDTIRALVAINPLDIDVSAPTEVELGKVFRIEAEAINRGKDKIGNATAEIFLPGEPPEGLVLVRNKDPSRKIGVITGKKGKKFFWSAEGGLAGNYIVSIVVSGEARGQSISVQDSTLITVTEQAPATNPPFGVNVFQIFFDFFQKWFK